jgi:M6 family metalloprotease-like protein
MSKPLSYYGGNNINGDDAHTAEMVSEAIHLVDNDTDFSLYDWDNDGEVEHIFVIHSGFDEAQSRRAADIWSHAWFLSEAYEYENDGKGAVIADGVRIDAYATSA